MDTLMDIAAFIAFWGGGFMLILVGWLLNFELGEYRGQYGRDRFDSGWLHALAFAAPVLGALLWRAA